MAEAMDGKHEIAIIDYEGNIYSFTTTGSAEFTVQELK
jgi:hypothetical protein